MVHMRPVGWREKWFRGNSRLEQQVAGSRSITGYLPLYVRRTRTGYDLFQGMAIRHTIKEKRDRFGNIGKGLEDVSGERYQRI
jgi:hypothetical protein